MSDHDVTAMLPCLTAMSDQSAMSDLMLPSPQGIEFDAEAATLEDQFGAPRGEPGQWAACLRIVDPASLSTVFVQELDNNEAITSMGIVQFAPAAVQVGQGGC